MKQEDYEKIASVIPMGGVIDDNLAKLRNAVEDATNQAENGSQLGMAVAVGRISNIVSDLSAAWAVVMKQ
jgi:hypothetical protein